VSSVTETLKFGSIYYAFEALVEGKKRDPLVPRMNEPAFLKIVTLFGNKMAQLQFHLSVFRSNLFIRSFGVDEEQPLLPEARAYIGRFNYWFGAKRHLLPGIVPFIQHYHPDFVLNLELVNELYQAGGLVAIEDAVQENSPAHEVALFLARREKPEHIKIIENFARKLFRSRFCPDLSVFLTGLGYLASHTIELSPKRRDELLCLFDRANGGSLKQWVDSTHDPHYLQRRRDAHLHRNIKVGGRILKLGALLSKPQPLGARHLTFVVKDFKLDGKEVVLRFGRHPISLILEGGTTSPYLKILPPLWLDEGIGVYERLMRMVDLKHWHTVDADQMVVLQRVYNFFDWMRQKGKILTERSIGRLGVDELGDLWAVSQVEAEPFTMEKLENAIKSMAGENILIFKELMRFWSWLFVKWDLSQSLINWSREFVDLGDLPPAGIDMSDKFMNVVDREGNHYNALIRQDFSPIEIGAAIDAWRSYTQVVQSVWKREREDLQLMIAAKRKGSKENLPEELHAPYFIMMGTLARHGVS
jgi:hypothetical protein